MSENTTAPPKPLPLNGPVPGFDELKVGITPRAADIESWGRRSARVASTPTAAIALFPAACCNSGVASHGAVSDDVVGIGVGSGTSTRGIRS